MLIPYLTLADPRAAMALYEHEWTFAHQVEEVSDDEMKVRAAEWARSMGD